MKKVLISLIILLSLVTVGGIVFWGENKDNSKYMTETPRVNLTRKAAVAGQFYPSQKEELKGQIDGFLKDTKTTEAEGEITALILPHAGYQFSGPVTAHGFKELINEEIDTVILIGNSHHEHFDGISIYPEGYFETPLGRIEIDADLAESIMREDSKIFFKESTHLNEHSLEVQLPFLQRILKNFKIVPILFGNSKNKDYQILAEAILKNIKSKNILLIASSDLSHYPSYKDAQYADKKMISSILTGEIKNFEDTISELEGEGITNVLTFACADDAIKTVMLMAKKIGANEIKLLEYANSGDTFHDKSRVVGYAAIGFFAKRRGNFLNKKEKEKLLTIAKKSVENFVLKKEVPNFSVEEEMLSRNLGTFVTLKKNGSLRGCIGTFSPASEPLFRVVSKMAIAAASQDSRFYPVQKEELKNLEYEISVLSELKEVDNWQKIEIGKHGVKIVLDNHSGVFLSQVATENNLNLEEFLGLLCMEKVGAEKDCYKSKEAKIYIFTAQVL